MGSPASSTIAQIVENTEILFNWPDKYCFNHRRRTLFLNSIDLYLIYQQIIYIRDRQKLWFLNTSTIYHTVTYSLGFDISLLTFLKAVFFSTRWLKQVSKQTAQLLIQIAAYYRTVELQEQFLMITIKLSNATASNNLNWTVLAMQICAPLIYLYRYRDSRLSVRISKSYLLIAKSFCCGRAVSPSRYHYHYLNLLSPVILVQLAIKHSTAPTLQCFELVLKFIQMNATFPFYREVVNSPHSWFGDKWVMSRVLCAN